MKKTITLLMIILLIVPLVSALETLFVAKDGDIYIIVDFTPQRKSIFDFFKTGAIIPSYVNAGELINFKGELLRNSPISDLLGTPNELEITIAKFDSSKPNFMGQTVNTFKIPIPSNIQERIKIETNIIFNAQMKVPSIQGKYRYRAIAKRSGTPITQINIDYDTFTVAQGVPQVCPSSDVETTYLTISNGKIKVITQTQYTGSDCKSSYLKTYNTICDNGYIESGYNENAKCIKQETPPQETPPPITECSQGDVCCKFRDAWWGDYTYLCKKKDECIVTVGKMYIETDPSIVKLKCGLEQLPTKKECYKCENNEKKFVKEVLSTELCPEGSMAKDLLKCVNNVTIPTEVILSESLTFDEWKTASSYERVKTICKVKSDCAPYEDLYGTGKEYTVMCSGDSRVQTQFQVDIEELCENTGALDNYLAVGGGTAGFLTGCYIGSGLGFTAGFSVLGIGAVPGAVIGCILGGTAGTTMTVSAIKGYSAYAIINCKEKKVAPGMGACIAIPKTGQIPSPSIIDTCPALVEDFGKMFGADKYACLIGWIFTIIAGIIGLVLLFKILNIFT